MRLRKLEKLADDDFFSGLPPEVLHRILFILMCNRDHETLAHLTCVSTYLLASVNLFYNNALLPDYRSYVAAGTFAPARLYFLSTPPARKDEFLACDARGRLARQEQHEKLKQEAAARTLADIHEYIAAHPELTHNQKKHVTSKLNISLIAFNQRTLAEALTQSSDEALALLGDDQSTISLIVDYGLSQDYAMILKNIINIDDAGEIPFGLRAAQFVELLIVLAEAKVNYYQLPTSLRAALLKYHRTICLLLKNEYPIDKMIVDITYLQMKNELHILSNQPLFDLLHKLDIPAEELIYAPNRTELAVRIHRSGQNIQIDDVAVIQMLLSIPIPFKTLANLNKDLLKSIFYNHFSAIILFARARVPLEEFETFYKQNIFIYTSFIRTGSYHKSSYGSLADWLFKNPAVLQEYLVTRNIPFRRLVVILEILSNELAKKGSYEMVDYLRLRIDDFVYSPNRRCPAGFSFFRQPKPETLTQNGLIHELKQVIDSLSAEYRQTFCHSTYAELTPGLQRLMSVDQAAESKRLKIKTISTLESLLKMLINKTVPPKNVLAFIRAVRNQQPDLDLAQAILDKINYFLQCDLTHRNLTNLMSKFAH